MARARGWEGVAEVTVTVAAGLPIPGVRLTAPSGYPALDEQAVLMLARAVEATPLPADLHGRNFVLKMPIRFSLQD